MPTYDEILAQRELEATLRGEGVAKPAAVEPAPKPLDYVNLPPEETGITVHPAVVEIFNAIVDESKPKPEQAPLPTARDGTGQISSRKIRQSERQEEDQAIRKRSEKDNFSIGPGKFGSRSRGANR